MNSTATSSTSRAPQFTVGQTVRCVNHHTGNARLTKVVHVGKRHVIVEWPDFSSKQARFNLKPTYSTWNNDYLGCSVHPVKTSS